MRTVVDWDTSSNIFWMAYDINPNPNNEENLTATYNERVYTSKHEQNLWTEVQLRICSIRC